MNGVTIRILIGQSLKDRVFVVATGNGKQSGRLVDYDDIPIIVTDVQPWFGGGIVLMSRHNLTIPHWVHNSYSRRLSTEAEDTVNGPII
jgi:hypothetical protein